MNEGGMIKVYIEKEHINEAEVAAAIGVSEKDLHHLYQSQTIEPDIKKKLQGFFNRNIFDGSILTEYYTKVPDNQANKWKT